MVGLRLAVCFLRHVKGWKLENQGFAPSFH